MRWNVEKIVRTEQRQFREVVAAWEQRVEGLKVVGDRVSVAAGDVGREAKAWRPGYVAHYIAGIRGCAPGADVPASKAAELVNEFPVPVPS